jgi:hypothetical protein
MDSEPILKKTLVTVGAMVGACVAFVGTISLVAVLVTSHVVGASDSSASGQDAREPSGSTKASVTPGGADRSGRAPHSDALPSHTTPRTHDTI